MKICFLGDVESIHFKRWVNFFIARGHDISIISLNDVPEIEGARTYYLSLRQFNNLSFSLRRILNRRVIIGLSHLIRYEIRPDILHAHYVTDYGFYAAATGFHPLVVTAWGNDVLLDPKVSSIYRWEARYSLRRADLITTDAEYLGGKISSISKVKRDGIHIIQWGMDFKNYGNLSGGSKLRKELGIGNDYPIILSARGFQSRCNIDVVIKSVSRVVREFPDAKFILLGGWGKEEYEKLSRKEGVSDYVIFPGRAGYKELFSFYDAADVMLSVSSIDGTPASLLEGMGYRCIPIVSEIPPHREWIRDGVNGFIVKLRDVGDLSNSIIRALKLPDKDKELIGDYNYKLVREKGDHRKNMLRMEELYFNLSKK